MYFFKYTASRRAIRNLINQSYSESNDTHNFVYYKNQHFHITIYINTTDVKRSLCKLFKSLKLKKKRESRKLFKLFKLKKCFVYLDFVAVINGLKVGHWLSIWLTSSLRCILVFIIFFFLADHTYKIKYKLNHI